MNTLTTPVVAWAAGADNPEAPLVVLLHGRGADEHSILSLVPHLPVGPSYAAVRAPIAEGGGYAWFANKGIGLPVAESLEETTDWFAAWLDEVAPEGRPVVLVGFSGGAAFAGGVILRWPGRTAGAAILLGTLPFEDAGVPLNPGRLTGLDVLVAQGDSDTVIPRHLLDRTWAWTTEVSGAKVRTHRDPGGHTLTQASVGVLAEWITSVSRLVPRASTSGGADRTSTGGGADRTSTSERATS
jgi:phospholipase/carboxylesterase